MKKQKPASLDNLNESISQSVFYFLGLKDQALLDEIKEGLIDVTAPKKPKGARVGHVNLYSDQPLSSLIRAVEESTDLPWKRAAAQYLERKRREVHGAKRSPFERMFDRLYGGNWRAANAPADRLIKAKLAESMDFDHLFNHAIECWQLKDWERIFQAVDPCFDALKKWYEENSKIDPVKYGHARYELDLDDALTHLRTIRLEAHERVAFNLGRLVR